MAADTKAYERSSIGSVTGETSLILFLRKEDVQLLKKDSSAERDISILTDEIMNVLYRAKILQDPKTTAAVECERKGLLGLFEEPIWVQELPNGYSPKDSYYSRFPWFKVYTTKGPITIGWRKRVIQIEWQESDSKVDGKKDFPSEDVTKEHHLIHAWSLEKAKEYLDKILE